MFFSQQSKTECLFFWNCQPKKWLNNCIFKRVTLIPWIDMQKLLLDRLVIEFMFWNLFYNKGKKNKWSVPSHFRVWVVCLFRFAPQSNLSRDFRNSSTPFILLRVSPMMAALSEFCRLSCKMYNKCVRLELRNFVIGMSEMLLAPDVLHHEWKLMYRQLIGYFWLFAHILETSILWKSSSATSFLGIFLLGRL